jgi:hypothetical protein
MSLPPFPVDDATLDMLMAAMNPWAHGDPNAHSSDLGSFLSLMSQMAGSDVSAIAEVIDDGSDGGAAICVMRDPQYSQHCVIEALVTEIRRLRDGRRDK